MLTQEHEDCISRRKKLEERACSLPCTIQNNSSHCHRSLPCGVIVLCASMQSLEETLEDLASLSLNYWLTKFAQEVADKNEIVNSARGMFTKFRKAFELHCKRKCKQQ